MQANLSTAYTAPGQDIVLADDWLSLEQQMVDDTLQVANLQDLDQMIAMARTGMAAAGYLNGDCPLTVIGGVVTVKIPVLVWPSRLDLDYKLTAGIGEVSGQFAVEESKSFDLVVPMADSVALPFLMAGTVITIEDGPIDEYGRDAPPDWQISNNVIEFDRRIFAVLRVSGKALGFRHDISMELRKESESEDEQREGYRIENLRNSVRADYTVNGDPASTHKELQIPACVSDYLAECPGDGGLEIDLRHDDPTPTIYYSDCDGHVMHVALAEDA